MAQTITTELLQLLEDKLGRDEAKKVASAIEVGFEVIEKKAEAVALQKKLELKDELTKELATKADLQMIELRLEAKIDKVKIELNTKLNFLIALMIIALTLMNPVMAEIIKNLLKL